VWKHENFNTIRSLVANVLPFSHYFDNGIIGTGTCIFAKVPLALLYQQRCGSES
jgi:hypothetical protein